MTYGIETGPSGIPAIESDGGSLLGEDPCTHQRDCDCQECRFYLQREEDDSE